MKRTSLALLAILGTWAIAGPAAAAQCPGERQDGKRVTMTGTIKSMNKGFGRMHNFFTRECPDIAIIGKNAPGCRVGAKIKATGEFSYCDYLFDDDCFDDVLLRSTITCG